MTSNALVWALAVVPVAAAALPAPESRRATGIAAIAVPLLAGALTWTILEVSWIVDRSAVGCFDGVPTCSKGDSVFYFALVIFSFLYTLELVAGNSAGHLLRARWRRQRTRHTEGETP